MYPRDIHSKEECANECNIHDASVFAFGTNDFGSPRCNEKGCYCLCEPAANADGTCERVSHSGYNLYKIISSKTGKPCFEIHWFLKYLNMKVVMGLKCCLHFNRYVHWKISRR